MIIKVIYHGRFGNNLFQYAFARLLAEQMGYGMMEYEGEYAEHFDGVKNKLWPNIGSLAPKTTQVLQGHKVDFNAIVADKTPRIIQSDGYYQRYEYYKDHRQKLKEWFKLPEIDFHPHQNDIVLHIRRSDFAIGDNILPFKWYHKVLELHRENIPFNEYAKVYITGGCNQMKTEEDIDHVVMQEFERYKPTYIDEDPITTFRMLQKFTNIVQSQSSYCWWLAFLSDFSKRIYTPIPFKGYWSNERPDIDLIVTDDSRYINLKQGLDW